MDEPTDDRGHRRDRVTTADLSNRLQNWDLSIDLGQTTGTAGGFAAMEVVDVGTIQFWNAAEIGDNEKNLYPGTVELVELTASRAVYCFASIIIRTSHRPQTWVCGGRPRGRYT